MGINEQIEHDLAEAMKAKEEIRLATLRLVRAAIKNAEIEQRTRGTADAEQLAVGVIKRHVKQTQEVMEDFKRGDRADLIARAEKELAILQSYLPAELSDAEISAIIAEVAPPGTPIQNIGKTIGEVMKKIAGRADGARVRALIEARGTTP